MNNYIGNDTMHLYYIPCKYKGLDIKRGYLRIESTCAKLYFEDIKDETDIVLYEYVNKQTFKAFVYDEITDTWNEEKVTFKPYPWLIDRAKRMIEFDNYIIPPITSPPHIGNSFEDHNGTLYLKTTHPGVFVKVIENEKPQIALILEDEYKYIFKKETDAYISPHLYDVELKLYMLLLTESNITKEN